MAPARPANLLGREREWLAIESTFEAGRPAVVLIAGGPRTGKSTFLTAVRNAAVDRGWRVAPTDEPGELRISWSTTEVVFCEAILTALNLPNRDEVVASPSVGSAAELLRRLSRFQSGVVLLVGGFEPEPQFADWFAQTLIPTLLASELPVLLVIADHEQALGQLVKLDGILAITLGPLDSTSVTDYLREIGRDIEPPLSDEELAGYAAAVSHTPDMFESLRLVLPLASRQQPAAMSR